MYIVYIHGEVLGASPDTKNMKEEAVMPWQTELRSPIL